MRESTTRHSSAALGRARRSGKAGLYPGWQQNQPDRGSLQTTQPLRSSSESEETRQRFPDPRLPESPLPAGGFTYLLRALREYDSQLYHHSLRVYLLTTPLLQALKLPAYESVLIELAALFHDIGKLGLPTQLLHKATALTAEEFALIRTHCLKGALLLSRLQAPQALVRIVYHHHERWDGHGYPTGLAGEAIPLGARLIAICDAFAVMTSGRSYQAPRTPRQALIELHHHAGTQFDPLLVELFSLVFNIREELHQVTTTPLAGGVPLNQRACARDRYRDGVALQAAGHPRP